MKVIVVRSLLLFSAVYLIVAASTINTNSLGDNNSMRSNVAKYVTPHGAGDHSGKQLE